MKALVKNAALLVACFSFITVGTDSLVAGEPGYGWGRGYGNWAHGYKEGQYFNHLTGQFEPIPGFPVGSEMLIPGDFGTTAGLVYLYCEGQRIECKVVNWTPKGITILLPVMNVSNVYGMLVCYNIGPYFQHPIGSLPIQLLAPPVVAPAGPAGAAAPAGGAAPIGGLAAPVDGAVAPAAGVAPVDGAAAPAGAAPAGAAPAGAAPAGGAPVGGAPVGGAPVGDTPAGAGAGPANVQVSPEVAS